MAQNYYAFLPVPLLGQFMVVCLGQVIFFFGVKVCDSLPLSPGKLHYMLLHPGLFHSPLLPTPLGQLTTLASQALQGDTMLSPRVPPLSFPSI